MTMNSQRKSATIYQFPARGRFASAAQRDEWHSHSDATAQRVPQTVGGGAWYHDAAIRDSEPRH